MYQAQNATMKPNHEKKKTRPYTFHTLNMGIDRALRLTGLISGAAQRYDNFIMMAFTTPSNFFLLYPKKGFNDIQCQVLSMTPIALCQ